MLKHATRDHFTPVFERVCMKNHQKSRKYEGKKDRTNINFSLEVRGLHFEILEMGQARAEKLMIRGPVSYNCDEGAKMLRVFVVKRPLGDYFWPYNNGKITVAMNNT